MPNRSKAKGTAFETSIVTYLRQWWDGRIERRALSGSQDKGDVAGFGTLGAGPYQEFVLECKNHKSLDLGSWVKEMEIERGHNLSTAGFVVHKRRGTTDPEKQYVTGTLGDLVQFGQLMYQSGLDTNY